jgi:hypothetical protein
LTASAAADDDVDEAAAAGMDDPERLVAGEGRLDAVAREDDLLELELADADRHRHPVADLAADLDRDLAQRLGEDRVVEASLRTSSPGKVSESGCRVQPSSELR